MEEISSFQWVFLSDVARLCSNGDFDTILALIQTDMKVRERRIDWKGIMIVCPCVCVCVFKRQRGRGQSLSEAILRVAPCLLENTLLCIVLLLFMGGHLSCHLKWPRQDYISTLCWNTHVQQMLTQLEFFFFFFACACCWCVWSFSQFFHFSSSSKIPNQPRMLGNVEKPSK